MIPVFIKLIRNGTNYDLKRKVLSQYILILILSMLFPIVDYIYSLNSKNDWIYDIVGRLSIFLINQCYILIRASEPFIKV